MLQIKSPLFPGLSLPLPQRKTTWFNIHPSGLCVSRNNTLYHSYIRQFHMKCIYLWCILLFPPSMLVLRSINITTPASTVEYHVSIYGNEWLHSIPLYYQCLINLCFPLFMAMVSCCQRCKEYILQFKQIEGFDKVCRQIMKKEK